ncbi:MAG: MMPL family transporter [Proteobacteria bacterium]|nr:MMPL family transporter [Pseudomonadota bacterium]MBU1739020.1 MMPL family transporter [Pseudomonadota bacterium]
MKQTLSTLYDSLVLKQPAVTLIITLLTVGFFAWHIPDFRLDASGDSLILENDADLYYHRQIAERYGSGDVLVVTYTAATDLFAPESLADLKGLRDELAQLEGVASVTTLLDVPLIFTTDISLSDVADKDKLLTLEKSGVDKRTVVTELSENPLYKGRLLSEDGNTTALLVNLPIDRQYRELLARRYQLREKESLGTLSRQEETELHQVSSAYRQNLTRLQHQESRLVDAVRQIIDKHRGKAELYLGGVPMITADMIAFIENDLLVFGVGVFIFLVITLYITFRKTRWVFLSLLCCSAAVITMLGLLGMMDWRVTVISSNFISLMLILTMALTIHLIERYLEIHARNPGVNQRYLVLLTVKTIALPCFYTAMTTAVAFSSLVVSGIRPVIDFGIMMTIGLIVSFTLAFILFPASVCLLDKDTSGAGEDFSHPFTLIFAGVTKNHGGKILILALLLAIISGVGITRLKVENRFIDYFREKTEIFRGMSLIDRKLGGTTPLDLVIDFKVEEEVGFGEDEFSADDGGGTSRWYADTYTMEEIEEIHDYLDALSETGEVLSLAILGKITTRLNDNIPLGNFELAILHKKTPADIREMLVDPYVAEDITQARFTMRIIESGHPLARAELLTRIRNFLVGEIGLKSEQIHFTNMYVLYNNMLGSLFRSQIMTIGLVFLGIVLMFLVLFRSLSLALIAIVPNMLPVAVVLGAMGWLGIPLDLMTITIASITIGISVDDTIHYIHRFQKEFPEDRNYLATMNRCHRSIGRAILYTTTTITIGFSILVLSNFIPTIYFGLFTGFAMLVALLGDLLLLPKMLVLFKPLGKEGVPSAGN